MGKNVESDNNKSTKSSRKKFEDALSKVIIRRLPPNFEKDKLLNELIQIFPEGLPEYDYFRFCRSDLSFSPIPFCRAYINFKNPKDILKFKEKLDGYLFTDGKGGKYPVVVEFAPFQGVPKRTKKRRDIKCGTIEKDSDYLSFVETLNQEVEPLPSAEVYLEQQEINKQNIKDAKITTPLIEFLKMKKTAGKSRNSSQRLSSSSSNSSERKRKPTKDNGKAPPKSSSFPDKPSRPQSANESQKKGSERKPEDFKNSKKFGKDDAEKKRQGGSHGGERKPRKSNDWKEKSGKDDKEEKEKANRKERPVSSRNWKEGKSQDDFNRPGSSGNRPSSSHRTPRREKVTKDPSRVSQCAAKNSSESENLVKGEKSNGKNEERTPCRQQADNKERIRNKDRPTQAIYQPGSRSRSRVDVDDNDVKNSGRPVSRERKERPAAVKGHRDNQSRDRDNRRHNRDNGKPRSKPDETSVSKE